MKQYIGVKLYQLDPNASPAGISSDVAAGQFVNGSLITPSGLKINPADFMRVTGKQSASRQARDIQQPLIAAASAPSQAAGKPTRKPKVSQAQMDAAVQQQQAQQQAQKPSAKSLGGVMQAAGGGLSGLGGIVAGPLLQRQQQPSVRSLGGAMQAAGTGLSGLTGLVTTPLNEVPLVPPGNMQQYLMDQGRSYLTGTDLQDFKAWQAKQKKQQQP